MKTTRSTTAQINVIVSYNAAAASITHDGVTAFGDSKRNNGEPRNYRLGSDLAVARAFIDLGEQLENRALNLLETA